MAVSLDPRKYRRRILTTLANIEALARAGRRTSYRMWSEIAPVALEVPEMAEVTAQSVPERCGNSCRTATSIEALNRSCYCLSLDEEALRRGLEADLGTRGLSSAMVETHPHLFASVPMFVSREHVERMFHENTSDGV